MHQRFWARVHQGAEHWLWQGAVGPDGYGRLSVGGRGAGCVYVHRFAYMVFYGPIPAGHDVHHVCRIRRCVLPDHLRAIPSAINRGRCSPALAREVRRMDIEYARVVQPTQLTRGV